MTLNKRILRSIGQKKIFYIGSILLCIFTTAFIIAAVSTGQTMKKAIDRFYREYKVEDAQLTLLGRFLRMRSMSWKKNIISIWKKSGMWNRQ